MTPSDKTSEKFETNDTRRAMVDRLPNPEPPLEDLPADWAEEDRKLERRRPDLAETEDDSAAL